MPMLSLLIRLRRGADGWFLTLQSLLMGTQDPVGTHQLDSLSSRDASILYNL